MGSRTREQVERWLHDAWSEFWILGAFAGRYRAAERQLSEVLYRTEGTPTEIHLVSTEANRRYAEDIAQLNAEVQRYLTPRMGETLKSAVTSRMEYTLELVARYERELRETPET